MQQPKFLVCMGQQARVLAHDVSFAYVFCCQLWMISWIEFYIAGGGWYKVCKGNKQRCPKNCLQRALNDQIATLTKRNQSLVLFKHLNHPYCRNDPRTMWWKKLCPSGFSNHIVKTSTSKGGRSIWWARSARSISEGGTGARMLYMGYRFGGCQNSGN